MWDVIDRARSARRDFDRRPPEWVYSLHTQESERTHRRNVVPQVLRTGIAPLLGSETRIHSGIGRQHRRHIDGIGGRAIGRGRRAMYVPTMAVHACNIRTTVTSGTGERPREMSTRPSLTITITATKLSRTFVQARSLSRSIGPVNRRSSIGSGNSSHRLLIPGFR